MTNTRIPAPLPQVHPVTGRTRIHPISGLPIAFVLACSGCGAEDPDENEDGYSSCCNEGVESRSV